MVFIGLIGFIGLEGFREAFTLPGLEALRFQGLGLQSGSIRVTRRFCTREAYYWNNGNRAPGHIISCFCRRSLIKQ